MIFVPLLHYFKCKNTYSGNEYGLRYRLTPGKRSVPDPEAARVREGGEHPDGGLLAGPLDAGNDRPGPAPTGNFSADRRGPRRRRKLSGGRLQRRPGTLEELPRHDGLRPLDAPAPEPEEEAETRNA